MRNIRNRCSLSIENSCLIIQYFSKSDRSYTLEEALSISSKYFWYIIWISGTRNRRMWSFYYKSGVKFHFCNTTPIRITWSWYIRSWSYYISHLSYIWLSYLCVWISHNWLIYRSIWCEISQVSYKFPASAFNFMNNYFEIFEFLITFLSFRYHEIS